VGLIVSIALVVCLSAANDTLTPWPDQETLDGFQGVRAIQLGLSLRYNSGFRGWRLALELLSQLALGWLRLLNNRNQ
jgi:hypothetical protein